MDEKRISVLLDKFYLYIDQTLSCTLYEAPVTEKTPSSAIEVLLQLCNQTDFGECWFDGTKAYFLKYRGDKQAYDRFCQLAEIATEFLALPKNGERSTKYWVYHLIDSLRTDPENHIEKYVYCKMGDATEEIIGLPVIQNREMMILYNWAKDSTQKKVLVFSSDIKNLFDASARVLEKMYKPLAGQSPKPAGGGKTGEILEAPAKLLILQLAEKLRVMHKFSYRIIASLPFSITTLDGKKATPAPITTADDIPANCKFLTTWEDVFDSYSNAFEQFLLWNEDAISLASNIQYEKNRELLISLTRIKHRATEILSSIKHDRKSKSILASGQDEIDTARGSLTNLLNCDLPDCSAVDFFVELKDLPSFADELEVASLISALKPTSGKVGKTKKQKHKKTLESEWSNPMTKSDMMIRLNINGYKKFNTFAKKYGIKQAGNRQLWQILLEKMDKNTRQKLEKA